MILKEIWLLEIRSNIFNLSLNKIISLLPLKIRWAQLKFMVLWLEVLAKQQAIFLFPQILLFFLITIFPISASGRLAPLNLYYVEYTFLASSLPGES